MRPPRLTAAALLTGLALTACAGAGPGVDAARAACGAYADTERHQVATTLEEAESVRASARSEAGRAAAEDDAWATLQGDLDEAYGHLDASAAAHNSGRQALAADEIDAYDVADRRVQADCAEADAAIGPRRP